MVTVRETKKVVNDNTRHIAANSPGAKKPKIVWLKASEASITPGMGVYRGGASVADVSGRAYKSGAGNDEGYGIVELDKKQISLCTDTYTSGDLIPVLPFNGNEGLVCRNVFITNPGTTIVPDRR
ncbi:unnamed protein product, partial [marine sediment metagenome]